MKNYLLVNRALAAEKNINYFINLFSRVKEHSSPTVNRRSTDGQSQRQYTFGVWKYVAMMALLLTLVCGQVWAETYTWSFANGSGTISETTTNFTSTSGSKTLIYDGGKSCGWGGDSGNKYLQMGGRSGYSNETPNDRFFKFLAPSSSGTISISYAGTVSTTEISAGSNGSLVWDVISPTANATSTSRIITGLTAGSTYVYISCPSNKSYIKSITWTDASSPLRRIYYSEMKTCVWETALESGASFTAHNSAIGLNGKGGSGWNSYFSNYLNISSSGGYATVSFSPALSLVSNESDKGRIRIYYSTTQANKNLSLEMNGSSAGTYNALLQYRTYVAEYTIPDATTNVSSIKMSQSGSGGIVIFAIEVLTYPSADESWALKGFGDWSTGTPMTGTGTVTCTKSLSADETYQFKVVETSTNTWYGSSDHKIGGTKTTSALPSGTATNIYLNTTEAGTYNFSFNTSTKVLTVTYPNSYKVYYKNTGSWGSVKVYKFTSISSITGENAAWNSAPTVSTTEVKCGDTYYYTTTDGYKTIIFYNGSNSSNKTGDMDAASGIGKYVAGTDDTWSSFPTYTFTYNANGGSGNVPVDSNSPYTCGDNITVLGNVGSPSILTMAGYSFGGWSTSAGSGDEYAAGDTYSGITGNTTLYAIWTREAPTSVSLDGEWAYFPGQTISITAVPTGGTSDFTYQWQKYKNSAWSDLSNGTDATDGGTFSGVTTNNLQISGCTKNNTGTYRCVVSKAGLDVNSSDANIKIYTLNGNYHGSEWVSNDITYSSGTSGTVSLTLNANSVYQFKIYDNYAADFKRFGYATGNYVISPVTYDCGPGNDKADIRLFTGPAGTYTFTVNIAHVGDNAPYVSVSIAYPSVTHPAEGYAYFEKPTEWTNVYLYWYTNDGDRMTDEAGSPELVTTADICGTTYYYAPIGTTFANVKYKGNGSNYWTPLSTTGCSGKYMDETTYASPSWESFATYTISFAGNGNTDGSMSSISSIACEDDRTLSDNAFVKTDYIFDGWKANVDVTIGDATVTAGTLISDGATIQNIHSDITLTAQWTHCSGPSITANGRSGITDGAHYVGDALGTLSVTASAGNGGELSYKWYQYDDAGGKVKPYTEAYGTNNTSTYNIPSNATCTARHYFCVVSEEGCSTTREGDPSGALTLTEATYSVTYNKNGDGAGGAGSVTGTVPSDATAYSSGDSVVVKDPGSLALTNYTFIGWNDKADGSGTYASPGARIKMSGDLTLYAVWQSASSCPGSSGGTVFALTMKTNTNTTKNIGIGESVLLGTTYATTLTGGNVSFTDVGTRTSGRNDTKAILQKGGSGNKDKIYFGGNDAMMTIYLDCALEEGDVITYTGGDTQLSFTTTPVYGNSVYTSSKSYTIPNASALIGKKIIYCWRKTTTSFSVTDISITRPASEYTGLSVTKDPSAGSASAPSISATSVEQGSGVTVIAGSAASGYVFLGWESENGTFANASNLSTTFTPTADNAVATARYAAVKTITIKFLHNGNTEGWTVQGVTTYPADQTRSISVSGDWTVLTFSNVYAVSNIDLACTGHDWDYLNTSTKVTDDACYNWDGTERDCCLPLSAPTSLTCSEHTSSSLTFTWTKAANASGYTATLYSDEECESEVATEALSDVNTVTFSGLTPNATYYCKVQSKGDGSTYCVDGGTTAAQNGTTDAPTAPTFSPASGSTVSGSQTITITGHSGSTVYYAWATSAQDAAAIYNGGSGSHGTADAGTASVTVQSSKTLYAISRLSDVNSSVSSASYTVDDTAPTLSSSVPTNGATDVAVSGTIVLTFSEAIASVDGSKFSLTGATKGAVAKDGSDAKKVNIAYSGASNSATVTLTTAAGAVTDAVGNTSAALSNISFTTEAAGPVDCVIFSLEDEIGSAEITHNKNDKTIITTGISYFFESGEDRIKLTPKSGSKFKNGDAISISGKVNKADKNFGIKVWASDGSTSAGEFNVTGSTSDKGASCSGTLTLASDESYIYIGRYASTGTTIQVLEIEGECAASCSTPAAPTSPTNGATTTNTQAVSWTDESNSAWEVYVSTSSSTPSASQAPTAEPASTSYTFTDLTASTEYHWWVRSVCDETHKSAWVVGTSFTTSAADVTAPTLSSSTPEDDATGVGVSGNIVLTFSENVTINDASKFSLTGGAGTLNTASASASGADVTIPYTGLAYNTTYTLATAAEAVKDGSNNKNAALSDITFTTLSATGSCNELNYVWQTGSSKTPKGVSHTYADSDVAMIDNDEDATTHITISGTNYAQKDGSKGSLNLAKAKDNNFLLTAASGYVIDSVYFYGKLEDGACRMSTDGSAWTTTLGDGSTGEKVYAIGVGTPYFGLKNNDEDSPAGVWIRTMMVKVCPAGTTYTVSYNANGHGTAPDAETDIAPGSTISAPDEPTADCWTFNGWYKESACTSAWNFAEDEVNSNITLYAKWTSNKARVKGLDYGETDYTVTPAETGDAITVTPVSASGVTYKWYSNTSDDVTGWSEIPSAETASYSPSIASVGTTYYWAVLVHECGNDTTSSVRINVAASKTDPTIAWGNVKLGSVDATPTYGGGGYTLTGTINAGDDATPTLDASMISADGGIVITDKSVNDASKTFSLTFDVTAAFDTTQAKITNIHFSLPSNSTYNDTVFSTDLSFDKCSGGSYSTDVYVVGYTNATGTSASSSAANKALKVAKSWISTASPSFTDKTSADVFTISATNASYYWKQSNQTIINTTSGATMRMYKVGKNSCTIEWTNSSLSFSKVRIIGRNESDDPSTVTVSNGTEEKTFTFAGEKQGELQIQEVSMEFVHGSKKGVRIKGDGAKEISAIIELVPTGSDGAGTGTATTLQWKSGKAPSNISGWDGEKIVKAQSDDDFTCVAEQTSATNSVGAITYASDNTDVATVNETTGEVDIVAGAAGGEATITATMARSGCFMRSTISYTISVAELECAIDPGTLSASATSKCKTADVTLTLSDYTTAGTTLQWYKSGTAEPLTDGSKYDIEGATMTTAEAGTYYVKVTLTEAECSLTSNNVTITNKGGAASVSKLVNQWYIKKGRVTPDIALWRLGEGSSYVANSAKADGVALTDQLGGCTVIARGSTIYLSGADPAGISAVGDVSLTVQVQDECGNTATSDAITIHKQVATDKHELAFVTTGTDYKEKEFTEDAWTAGIKAANSTGLALYQVLKDTFKIQATNIYASDDEKKIREYYSQFDIICITDYPNTKTKGKNSKSYVDAMGSLIDIRPVLTMEAWVSGLDNWRNKGVVGTRTTPSKRQYNMYLQCKDHEIFEGVKIQQIGYGDDALFKVNMVDSTQSRYAQLDAVGKDSHATDTAALQGFTTGDMDLLALGLIDNGSGTNLQVGAERQNVMTARMMILGVNSYAMERLSDDGMRVIVNALQYLTKKRAEDISDCSTYFVGTEDENWNNPANWRSGTLPYSNQEARILQPVVVTDTRKIASVKIVADGTFQDQEAHGSLTIASTGALIVESKIQSSIGPDVLSGYPTETSHITIQTDESGQGALIFDNSNGETQATVDLYSKGCNDGSYKFQYFASPFMDISSWAFGDAYIYTHDESLDPEWTQLRYGEDVSAFQGLAITADGAARNYTIDGTLASTNSHTYNLTYTDGKAKKKGTNVIGNSWSAPIQITRIDDSDFDNPSNFEGVIYIYNAGRDVLVDGNVYASVGNSEPGQWQSIPVDLAKTEEWEHKRQIPAFQAFQMKVNAATEFTLDYNKHVRQEATIGVNNHNEKLHAPRRTMRAEEVKVLRLCVEDAQVGKSYIYLCEGDQFTEERDRGWEAQQTVGSGKYGKLYAIDQAQDYMMSIARESLEGTPVGFISGLSTEYTITFNETEGTYYLNDLETQQSTLIQEGESYSFTTTKGNHPNRFIISAIPFDKPGMATGVTDLDADAPKVQKVIYNDKLFIIRGGKVFSADGQLVK